MFTRSSYLPNMRTPASWRWARSKNLSSDWRRSLARQSEKTDENRTSRLHKIAPATIRMLESTQAIWLRQPTLRRLPVKAEARHYHGWILTIAPSHVSFEPMEGDYTCDMTCRRHAQKRAGGDASKVIVLMCRDDDTCPSSVVSTPVPS